MREAVVLAVQAFAEEMREDEEGLDLAWVPFYAQHDGALRLIALTRRFNLNRPQERITTQERRLKARARALEPLAALITAWEATAAPPPDLPAAAAALPATVSADLVAALGCPVAEATDLWLWQLALDELRAPIWRLSWLQEYRQMYETLMSRVALRGLEHYLVAWAPAGMRPEELVPVVQHTFDTGAALAPLPPILPGEYEETRSYLAPREPHHPLVTFLTSHALTGVWSTGVLHRVLALDLDLAICVDSVPLDRTKTDLLMAHTITSKTNQIHDAASPRDVRAERQLRSAIEIQDLLADGQRFHDLRVVIAVFGRDPAELSAAVRQVQAAVGGRMALMRAEGDQLPLADFFTTTPTAQIGALTRPLRRPSHALAVATMFGYRKPARDDGILWLIAGDAPIMFNPFAEKRPGHAVFLGKTGSGKTFALNTLLMRLMVEMDVQAVLYEPQGHSRRLVQAAKFGAARYVLDLRQQVNVLDAVATRGEFGEPPSLAEQIAHVTTQLAVLLGSSHPTGEGRTVFVPRTWTNMERSVLDLALQAIYAGCDLETLAPQDTPILADLCDALMSLGHTLDREKARVVACDVADELYLRLVRGSNAATFNARTAIDWDFSHQLTAYDFSQIPDGELRVYYYGQAFGALNRYVRSPERNRARTMIGAIDEFAYMARVPMLAGFAASAAKTWRTFNAAIWTLDQDAHTYLGTENGSPDPAMLSVFMNAPIKVIMRQDSADAHRLKAKIQGLRDAHVQEITRLSTGRCVLVWDGDNAGARHNEVFLGMVEPTEAERRAFRGT